MPGRGEVLVAILRSKADMVLAREQHWYRIPVSSVDKMIKRRWPPQAVAFYLPKAFGEEAFAVHYFAQVYDIQEMLRSQLFPDQPAHPHANELYYKLILGPVDRLPEPIPSKRLRRIVFIPTNWEKVIAAHEINDLFDDSPLEDRLWGELRRLGISAERQEYVKVKGRNYALDFALYCLGGKLDVETDGDTWHSDPERIRLDNRRDNDLETADWRLLRFNTQQINEEMESYTLPTIIESINQLGGLDEGRLIPRRLSTNTDSARQMSLFDDQQD